MNLISIILLNVKNKIDNFRIKLYNWRLGNGFKMPEPLPDHQTFYNYCRRMLEGSEDTIYAYEEKIKNYQSQFNNASRKRVLKLYIEAFEELYEIKGSNESSTTL